MTEAVEPCPPRWVNDLSGTSLDGGVAKSPLWAARGSVGPMTAATRGLASYAGGTFTLEVAYATPSAAGCTS